MNELFLELIRISLGTQHGLSRQPSSEEWDKLFRMAEKQALSGVCYVGLSYLGADSSSGYGAIGMSGKCFFDWMGRAFQIQMRNELVNRRCVEIQTELSEAGFESCVLKGQGLASLYGDLAPFRQPGDIDLWVNADMEKVVSYVFKRIPSTRIFDIKHVEYDCFPDVSVELHYRPSIMRTPGYRRAMAAFSRGNCCWDNHVDVGDVKITVPRVEYNIVYVLQHIYGHLFENALSMRQFMDYYMVLKQAAACGIDKDSVYRMMSKIGMRKFAAATMWIMKSVFGLSNEMLVCEPDEKEGRFLLALIMDKGKSKKWKYGSVKRFVNVMFQQVAFSAHIVSHYPSESIWAPMWLVGHFLWKRLWLFKFRTSLKAQ